MKRTSVVGTTVGALLLSTAGASADVIWSIGTQDGVKNEFSFGKGFGGTNDNGCGTTFVVGSTPDSDFPFELRSADASTLDSRFANSCQTVQIQFQLGGYFGTPAFNFWRMGGERTDVYLNDELSSTVGPNPVTDPNPSTLYPVGLGEYLAPGSYTLKLDGAAIPIGADGYHWVDYLELTGDPLEQYAKVSGRVDDPALAGRNGRGEPLYTFSGFLGLTAGGATVGSVTVNYKSIGDVCEFTGGTLSFPEIGKGYLAGASRNCDSGSTGTADLAIYDRSWGGTQYCVNDTGRGCLGVSDGPGDLTSPYRVGEAAARGDDPTDTSLVFWSYSADIDAGNGIVVQ